jgi:tRNA pseudouridine55 synthase
MDGLILINKSKDMTSHDVVIKIRKITGEKRVGHFGTLDPLATGLLIIALGKATRFFPFYSTKDKVYRGEQRFGYATNTYDSTGDRISSLTLEFPEKKKVLQAMKKFIGEILQIPPPFSAKKYKGKPLYFYARKNETIEVKPEKIKIYTFKLLAYDPPLMQFEVKCSAGTYIRSLVHDLGQNLNCGAHLTALCRTECSGYSLDNSHILKDLERSSSQELIDALIPINEMLPEFPKLILKDSAISSALNGNMITIDDIAAIKDKDSSGKPGSELLVRLFNQNNEFIALAKKRSEKNCFHPFLVLDSHLSIH